jgi:hypothetical protein
MGWSILHSGGNEGFVCYYVGSFEDGNGNSYDKW